MRSRFLLATALVLGLAVAGRAAPVPAGGKAHGPPIVFQLAPVDTLLASARGIATAVAGPGVVGLMDGAIKAKLGDKGWAGLDPKKPIVGYVNLPNKAISGPEDFKDLSGVLAIPVTTEDEFKALPERLFPEDPLVFKPVDGNKGLYAVETRRGEGQAPVRMRVHNGYAYVGINTKDEQLDAAALPAVADLAKANDPGLVVVRFFTDRYPEEVVKQSTRQLEEALEKLKGEPRGGRAEWTFGVLDSYLGLIKRTVAAAKDAEESGFRLVHDEKAAEVAFESYVVPRKNTAYAQEVADAKPLTNRFAGLASDRTAAALLVGVPLGSRDFKEFLTGLVDAGLKGKDDAPPPARPVIEELLKGLGRTVKGDSFDLAVALTAGKDGHSTAVAAVTFDDASGLEKAVKDALKDAPQNVQDMVKLDAEKVEGVSVHRISPPNAPEKVQKLFGSTDILVAFGPKGIYAAVGTGAKDALAAAITAKPAAAKAVDLIVNPKRVGELAAAVDEQAGKGVAQVLGSEDARISAFYVTYAGGKTMTTRVGVSLKVLPKAVMGVIELGKATRPPEAPVN